MKVNRITKSMFGLWFAMTATMGCSITPTASEPPRVESQIQACGDLPAGDNGEYELQFINENEGWLANGKKLWRTSDGGRSWEEIYSGESSWVIDATIYNLNFIDSSTGWMSVSPEGVYKTENGGVTWQHQSNPISDGAVYSLKYFKDGKEGWAAGVIDHPPPSKYADKVLRKDSYTVIAHTTNGGKIWNQQIIPFTQTISAFYFPDEQHGWALGVPGLFYLDNKNKTWRKVDFYKGGCANENLMKTLHGNNYMHEPTALYFLDSKQGWLAFKNGYMAKTTDGGKTWCDLVDPRSVWPDARWDTYFEGIHFTDSITGWGLGFNSIYETKDGGISWKRVDAKAQFRKMRFLDASHGWAVTSEGIYCLSKF